MRASRLRTSPVELQAESCPSRSGSPCPSRHGCRARMRSSRTRLDARPSCCDVSAVSSVCPLRPTTACVTKTRRCSPCSSPSSTSRMTESCHASRGFTELVSSIVPWLQRRHRERSVLEYLVGVTEQFMEERGLMPPQPRRPPAIAFLDLTGYTALAEEQGDEAAAELASNLASFVQEAAQTHRGRPVKWLGDGVMFHFGDPGGAILSALDLVEQTEREVSVPARVGINAGAVIAQEGDYFGRTVNVAARIADYARPHEVLVSEEAKRSAGVDEVEFELVGDVPLKGVSQAVRLHRALRAS